jgi:lipoprotein-anchoring transpeptidase ErfK/SrfK
LVAGGLVIAQGTASAVTTKPPVHGTASGTSAKSPVHHTAARPTAKTPASAQDTTLMMGTPCTVTARACVDLTTQKAWLFKDNAIERGPVDITSGGPGKETPTGNFTVAWKDRNHVNPELTPMPYSVFFAEGGVAFHGGSLQKQSAGCVHLDLDEAIIFYDSLAIGAPVQVRGVAPANLNTSGDDRSHRSGRRGADLSSDGPDISDGPGPSPGGPQPSSGDLAPSSNDAPPSRGDAPSGTGSRPSSTARPSGLSGPSDG